MGMRHPLVLMIMDGWGLRKAPDSNAIKQAGTPNLDRLHHVYPGFSTLKASGSAVGLRPGFQGNSEVGHINLGAGRTVDQMMVKIDKSIKDGSFKKNRALLTAIRRSKKNGSVLHIMGLAQDQGVHSMTDHGLAVLALARSEGHAKIVFHVFTDGRDTAPRSALRYLRPIYDAIKATPGARIGCVIGRYFAMDRDTRWDRTHKAYSALVDCIGKKSKSPLQAIKEAYKDGESDEFICPRIIDNPGVKDGDAIIFFNYRLDRARQLTRAFCEKDFDGFKRKKKDILFCGMTRYYEGMSGLHAFDDTKMKNILGKVLSSHGVSQLRVAETEKYAHVTYFFNGEEETPFKGEDRILIPSPKVATYEVTPAMSAYGITKAVIDDIHSAKHDVCIINFANADMVGHTGYLKAAKKAVQVVDECVGKIVDLVIREGGVALVTADHGNAELMKGRWKTSHTTNDVPLYLFGMQARLIDGKLADVAPTILKLLNIKRPKEMTGRPLL